MRFGFLTGCLILIETLSVLAAVPDYSGTWVLNKDRNENQESGRGMSIEKIVVRQGKNTFTAEKFMSNPVRGEYSISETVTLDSADCVMDTEMGLRTSQAVWSSSQNAISIYSQMNTTMGGKAYSIQFHETWKLDSNGDLKLETTRKSPRGERYSVQYYSKSE